MIIRLRQRQRRARSPNGPNSAPRIPAERDEAADSQEAFAGPPRDDIKQAAEDIKNGLVDTEMYRNGVALNPLDNPDANHTDQTPPLEPAPGKHTGKSSKR
jgi:hypothetical protein